MSSAGAIAILRAAYPRSQFPDATIRLYGEMLSDLDDAAVESAVKQVILTSDFLPTIATIRSTVADMTLNLPTTEEAWEIAERGVLRDAAEPVRRAAEHVGGRWAILHSDNIATVRAQFVKAYRGLRQRALDDFVIGGRPELAGAEDVPERLALGPTMAALPDTQRIRPRPVMARLTRRWAGRDLEPPTEEEKSDAIDVLRDFDQVWVDDPADDPLYAEAERIFEEAGR